MGETTERPVADENGKLILYRGDFTRPVAEEVSKCGQFRQAYFRGDWQTAINLSQELNTKYIDVIDAYRVEHAYKMRQAQRKNEGGETQ